MTTPRPLACCDCGTTDPRRFALEVLERSDTRAWRWWLAPLWRMSGVPFGAPHDFGFCLACAERARVRAARRAKRRAPA